MIVKCYGMLRNIKWKGKAWREKAKGRKGAWNSGFGFWVFLFIYFFGIVRFGE